ncbi:Rpn family recombination-promoting nuclease/putative transposase [Bernardetia sp. ABR2-2B]|uniref:Rpn family recombination-promoting nuclease/putative transposase n=1 Tax=Bernardetia sp. ABR2-2B TaxID=3127472 RepID=UPI0030CDC1BC
MTEKYINLFTDFGFKKIFGEEPNKDLLISFLNELLRDREEIIDLTYLNTEHLGKSDRDRKAIYDLYCTNQEGEKFIIEVQRVKQQFFKDRSLYYSTFAIQEQALKGKDWKYELYNVYTIGILDFVFDDSNSNQFHHNVKLVETNSNKVFYDKLTFVFLEIPKFDKKLEELENDYEKWLFAFKNLHKLADRPDNLQEGVFRRLLEVAEVAKYDKEDQFVYQESLKEYWDLKSSMDTYFMEGMEEGAEKQAIKTAIAGIKDGFNNSLLMKLTDLSEEQINMLRKSKK